MMEQENNPERVADQQPVEVLQPTVGQQLREARERLGLSIEEVVAKIKLASRQIEALEADDFKSLPETAFVRGFVRGYAKLLQLDAQPLLDALPGAQTEPVKAEQFHVEAPFPSERTARRQNLNLLIAALAIAVVIAGFAVWQARTPPLPAQPSPSPEEAALVATPLPLPEQAELLDGSSVPEASGVAELPVSAPVVTAAPVVAAVPVIAQASAPLVSVAKSSLRLVFDKTAWAQIKDQSGNILSKQVNPAGSELRVEGAAPFALVIGHAASVHLFYQDKPVDLSSYTNASSDVARLTLE